MRGRAQSAGGFPELRAQESPERGGAAMEEREGNSHCKGIMRNRPWVNFALLINVKRKRKIENLLGGIKRIRGLFKEGSACAHRQRE